MIIEPMDARNALANRHGKLYTVIVCFPTHIHICNALLQILHFFMKIKIIFNTVRYRLSSTMKIARQMMPRRLSKLTRQASRNDDSDINELLSTSLSELFPEDRKAGKLDEYTNQTIESTERDMSEDEISDHQGDYLKKLISFEQDENGESRVIEIDEESDGQSLNFQDVFPEYQPGIDDSFAFVELEENFAQVVCDVDVRSLRREERKRVIKAFLGPMKSLMKPVKIPKKKNPRIKSPTHFPAVKFRNKRSRVTFTETPTDIVEDMDEALGRNISEGHFEEIESAWYNDLEYDAMKQSVLKTMEKIVRCHKKKREFPENKYQTARGLELVTKETIVERKLYKVTSRHVVFDEQEEQRLAHRYNPERIRDRYVKANINARDTALEYGWKDQEAVHELNEESVCITEEDTHFY